MIIVAISENDSRVSDTGVHFSTVERVLNCQVDAVFGDSGALFFTTVTSLINQPHNYMLIITAEAPFNIMCIFTCHVLNWLFVCQKAAAGVCRLFQ